MIRKQIEICNLAFRPFKKIYGGAFYRTHEPNEEITARFMNEDQFCKAVERQ
jgi:hypothetical protein